MVTYKQKGNWAQVIFFLFDLCAMGLSYLLSLVCRFDKITGVPEIHLLSFAVLVVVWFAFVCVKNVYQNMGNRGYYIEFLNVLKSNLVLIVASLGFLFFSARSIEYSRLVYVYFFALNINIMYLFRVIEKKKVIPRFKHSTMRQEILLVTVSDKAKQMIDKICDYKGRFYWITDLIIVDKDMTGMEIGGIPVTGSRSTVMQTAMKSGHDAALVAVPQTEPFLKELIDGFHEMALTIYFYMDLEQMSLPNAVVDEVCGMTVLTSGIRLRSTYQILVKRLMDIAGGIAGLILTGLISIVLVPAIKIASPGPAFFSQERVGLNGRHFRIWKFRSMYLDAEERKKELMAQNEMDGQMFKIKDDPRIIGGNKGIGGFIRKTSLDEFPQFWNVLKGEMSLVGTRPPTVDEVDRYMRHHYARLSVKPGLTGMWQTSGRSEITNFEDVVRMDMDYIHNWSIGLDIKLILKTIVVIFTGRGAS